MKSAVIILQNSLPARKVPYALNHNSLHKFLVKVSLSLIVYIFFAFSIGWCESTIIDVRDHTKMFALGFSQVL